MSVDIRRPKIVVGVIGDRDGVKSILKKWRTSRAGQILLLKGNFYKLLLFAYSHAAL